LPSIKIGRRYDRACRLDFVGGAGEKGYTAVTTQTTQTVRFVSWQEDGGWLGYLEDYPDYWTQGDTLDDLKDHLKDLYADMSSGELPGIRKVDDLVIP
jgi:predicted RNase H-like HicB family nuclease